MNPSLSSQASQNAAQGQQLLASDQATAAQGQTDYNNYQSQASQANQNLQAQTQYMQGAGSGQNVYNTQLQGLTDKYDPNIQGQLSGANASLFAQNGALNGANQAFNTPGGVGAYGLSASALGGYESSVLQPLQQGVQNANTEVGTLNNQLGTLMTGANQATTSQVQTEQNAATSLTSIFQNASSQAAQALSQMQAYSQLAQQQGGLNATNQQAFAQAQQAYAAAQQAIAQSKFIAAQTTGQNYTNQADLNQLNAIKNTASPAVPTPNANNTVNSGNLISDSILNGLPGNSSTGNTNPSILSQYGLPAATALGNITLGPLGDVAGGIAQLAKKYL